MKNYSLASIVGWRELSDNKIPSQRSYMNSNKIRRYVAGFFAILILCLGVGCDGKVDYDDLIEENGIYKMNNSPYTGTAYEYWDGGDTQRIMNFKDGKLHGEMLEYSWNGYLKSSANFINGMYFGDVITYHPNGSVRSVRLWFNGFPDGNLTTYNQQGELIEETLYEVGDEIEFDSNACSKRDQLETQIRHANLAADLGSELGSDFNRVEFMGSASHILESMYHNFCRGEELTFTGKIGDLRTGSEQLYVRFDDMINTGERDFLFLYEATIDSESDLYEKIDENFDSEDIVLFVFNIADGISPKKRKVKLEKMMERNSGSFPFNTINNGQLVRKESDFTNEMLSTFPDGNYIFFPTQIDLIEINSLAELFRQHR